MDVGLGGARGPRGCGGEVGESFWFPSDLEEMGFPLG